MNDLWFYFNPWIQPLNISLNMYKHDINVCCFWYTDQCIWHWSHIIWRLQSWWIWCFWSCRPDQRSANQFTSELHWVIIIKFYRSTGDWNCHRWDEGSDLGWIFALWIDNECCRPCHRHCRLSRSSCSWHTLYKVNHFFLLQWPTMEFSVFGESILNDGVAVVLFQVFESFIHLGPGSITPTNIYRSFLKFSIVAGGGTIIGLLFGYLGSFIFRGKSKLYLLLKTTVQVSDSLVA